MSSSNKKIQEILNFWFGEDPKDPLREQAKWWKKDEAFDSQVKQKFATQVQQARQGELDEWQNSAKGSLALIILLDQFPRNLYRNNAQAFASDPKALQISKQAIARGLDHDLPPVMRWFLYIPLMHSEDGATQKFSLKLYGALSQEGEGPLKQALLGAYDFAKQHAEIIFRFGRYPHRNEILGRKSTIEEMEFLKQPGSSF